MRITIETTDHNIDYAHKVIREVSGDDVELPELLQTIREALLGFGYHPKTVSACLGGEVGIEE